MKFSFKFSFNNINAQKILSITIIIGLLGYTLLKSIRKRKKVAQKKRVVVIGLVCLDIHACHINSIPDNGSVKFIDNIHLSLAGTAGGTAVTLSKFGIQTSLFGSIGKDEKAVFITSLMHSFGINTKGMQLASSPEQKTSSTVITVKMNGDRPCFHQRGASDYLDVSSPTYIDHIFNQKATVIHIGGLGLFPGCPHEKMLQPLLEGLLLRKCQSIIVLDLIAPHSMTLSVLTTLLPMVDFFMPSLEEACDIAGFEDRNPLFCGKFFLALGVRCACIFKDGCNGSYCVARHSQLLYTPVTSFSSTQTQSRPGVEEGCLGGLEDVTIAHIPAVEVEVVDTTGCGDNYCAGFEAAICHDWSLFDCCKLGTAAAALCATGVGSDAGNIDFNYAVRFMKM